MPNIEKANLQLKLPPDFRYSDYWHQEQLVHEQHGHHLITGLDHLQMM